MNIYTFILYALFILSICELFWKNKDLNITIKFQTKKISFNSLRFIALLIIVLLVIVSSIRDISVGRDLINYIPRFKIIGVTPWQNILEVAHLYSFEIGFTVLCKLIYSISSSPQFFLYITSILVGIGFYTLTKFSKLPIMTIFIIYAFGIYGSSMNILRQFIAFSILMYSLPSIIKRDFLKFLFFLLLASSIHSTSIIFIVIYYLYNIEFNKKNLTILLIMCAFMATIGNKLMAFIISKTSFSWYLAGYGNGSGTSTLILLIIIIMVSYFFRKNMLNEDKYFNLWIWCVCIALLFNSLALTLGLYARIMKFFIPFIAIIIVDIVLALKKRESTFIIAGLSICVLFTLYFNIIFIKQTAVQDGLIPYTTYIDNSD